LGLAEQFRSVDRAGHDVQHLAVRCAEIAGHVAALLFRAGDAEGADFLIRRSEKRVEVVAHVPVRQSVPTERLSVVSGEIRIFEVARDMEKKRQFVVLPCFPGRFRRSAKEIDICAVVRAG